MRWRIFVPDFPECGRGGPRVVLSKQQSKRKKLGKELGLQGSYVGKGLEKDCSYAEKPNKRSKRGSLAPGFQDSITWCRVASWRWFHFALKAFHRLTIFPSSKTLTIHQTIILKSKELRGVWRASKKIVETDIGIHTLYNYAEIYIYIIIYNYIRRYV